MNSNPQVIRAWALGRRARGNRIKTDGLNLFSYKLKIGATAENGEKIVYDYTEKNFISMTTFGHISQAKIYCDEIKKPEMKK